MRKKKEKKKNSIRSFSNEGMSEFDVIMKFEHDTFADCCSSTSNKTTIFQFQQFRFKFQVIYKFKHENAILSYRCAHFYLQISDFGQQDVAAKRDQNHHFLVQTFILHSDRCVMTSKIPELHDVNIAHCSAKIQFAFIFRFAL